MWSKLGTWPAGQKNKHNNHIHKHITESQNIQLNYIPYNRTNQFRYTFLYKREKTCSKYAENVGCHLTTFSCLGKLVLVIFAPLTNSNNETYISNGSAHFPAWAS